MAKRYLVIAGEWGVYFGFMPGGQGFFSLIDTIGLPAAPVFSTATAAHQHVRQWIDQPSRYDVVPIECLGAYATLREIDRAGYGHILGDAYAKYLQRVPAAGSC